MSSRGSLLAVSGMARGSRESFFVALPGIRFILHLLPNFVPNRVLEIPAGTTAPARCRARYENQDAPVPGCPRQASGKSAPDMAIPVIVPLADKGVIAIALRQGLIRRQKVDGVHQKLVEFLAEDP